MDYEIIVVGGGHAGCEAAMASARKGHKTLLISGRINNIATMPCNPSIGGSAKGIIVREIDALGGVMGEVADKTLIQMKMLNYAKGPAVKSLRAQADKITYPKEMLKLLREEPNLTIKEAMVENLIVKDNTVYGVVLEDGTNIKIYDLERTICDVIKNKNRLDQELVNKALRKYFYSKEKNTLKLYEYAKKMKIYKKVRSVFEILG